MAKIKDEIIKKYENGTPYSDEMWQKWYGYKSNKERFLETNEQAHE